MLCLYIDTILGIMSNAIGVIHTQLMESIQFRTSIHRLGPHQVNVCSRSYNFVLILASVVKFLGASYRIWIKGNYSCVVWEEASVDNFGYFGG